MKKTKLALPILAALLLVSTTACSMLSGGGTTTKPTETTVPTTTTTVQAPVELTDCADIDSGDYIVGRNIFSINKTTKKLKSIDYDGFNYNKYVNNQGTLNFEVDINFVEYISKASIHYVKDNVDYYLYKSGNSYYQAHGGTYSTFYKVPTLPEMQYGEFVSNINEIEVKNDIYYIPNGTGNDFYKSIKKEIKNPVNKYLLNLPTVEFDDRKLFFLNGCGTGLDGYVCSLVNDIEKKGKLSFFRCTYKGFRKYKRTNITVTVDGVDYEFKKVFLASIMNGNVEGGGMKMTPKAKRLDEYIDICIIHSLSKFSLILCFPLIYLGWHRIKRKAVTILSGKEISIKCSEGLYMQVDGEDFKDIKEIHAKR